MTGGTSRRNGATVACREIDARSNPVETDDRQRRGLRPETAPAPREARPGRFGAGGQDEGQQQDRQEQDPRRQVLRAEERDVVDQHPDRLPERQNDAAERGDLERHQARAPSDGQRRAERQHAGHADVGAPLPPDPEDPHRQVGIEVEALLARRQRHPERVQRDGVVRLDEAREARHRGEDRQELGGGETDRGDRR